MFFSGRTWFIIILLSIVLGVGIKRHLKLRSVIEQFEVNSTLPEGIDAEAIIKEAGSK
jgi:hypothetical protein